MLIINASQRFADTTISASPGSRGTRLLPRPPCRLVRLYGLQHVLSTLAVVGFASFDGSYWFATYHYLKVSVASIQINGIVSGGGRHSVRAMYRQVTTHPQRRSTK